MNDDAVIKDLDLSWQDHFHMRDQTWKTLTNTALLFIGVVGLEIKAVDRVLLVLAYLVVTVTAACGWAVAYHHRRRQNEKFAIIREYEKRLGLLELKGGILDEAAKKKTILDRINTAVFVEIMQIGIFVVSLVMLGNHVR